MLGLPIAEVLLLTVIIVQASSSATAAFADTTSSCNICTIGNNANTIQQQIITQIAQQNAQQTSANSQNIQQVLQQLASQESDIAGGNAKQSITQIGQQRMAQQQHSSITNNNNNECNCNNNNTSSKWLLPTNTTTGVYLIDIHVASNDNPIIKESGHGGTYIFPAINDNNSTIHVGDNITLIATIVNNSSNTISFSPYTENRDISATFDRGVSIVGGGILPVPSGFGLNSGNQTTVTIPNSEFTFKAIESGIVHSEITLNYGIVNSGIHSVTAPFTFYIYK